MRRLTGPEIGKVRNILLARLGGLGPIRTFAKQRLDIAYDDHVPPIFGLADGIFQYVNHLNQNWKHYELINAFLAEFPDDPEMLKFAAEFGVLAGMATDSGGEVAGLSALEALVNAGPFLDIDVLLRELSRVERAVCRMEVELTEGGSQWGSGFLIGEDLLMTNYHVVDKLIEAPDQVQAVNCLFDYKVRPDGQAIYQGTLVELAANPVVHFSKVGALDISGSAELNAEWEADKLDYAVLRLARKIGGETFGPGQAFGMETRGWLKFPEPAPPLFSGSHAIIVQHPQKGPKKVAFGFEKVMGTDDQGLRVRYAINTAKGSSGSPCFNHKFELIALHNAGDANYNPAYNQGIPIGKIREDLAGKGLTFN